MTDLASRVWLVSPVTDPRGDRPDRIGPLDWHIADMRGYFSPGRAFNHCWLQGFQHREITCVVSDKCKPTLADIERGVSLIDDGNLFVGLYRMAFFLAHYSIIEKVGWWDERFLHGVGEELDYVKRMHAAGVKHIYEESVTYLPGPSKWKFSPYTKWSPPTSHPQYPVPSPDPVFRVHPVHGTHEG